MVHSSKCVASLVNDGFASTEVHRCFIDWFWVTQTSFFGVDLDLPLWFGLFCFNYSIGGIMMLLTKPKWIEQSRFPYMTFAFLLIFVQGPLSCWADYVHMSNDSIAHSLDKALAVPLMMMEVWKVTLMIWHGMKPMVLALYSMATTAAIVSLLNSSEAQLLGDRDGFVFWHGMWHIYPLIVSIIISVDYYFFGGDHACANDDSAKAVDEQQESAIPLSSYVMTSRARSKIKSS